MKKEPALGARGKNILKLFHLLFIAVTAGGLAAVLFLVIIKSGFKNPAGIFPLDYAAFKIFDIPVTYGFFMLLASSYVFSFFTEWGFLRFRWVAVKWLALLLLFFTSSFWLAPSLNGMVSLSDAGFHTGAAKADYGNFTVNAAAASAVSLALMFFAFLLSVLKPWGPMKLKISVNRGVVLIVTLAVAGIGIAMGVLSSVMMSQYRNMKIEDTSSWKLRDGAYEGKAVVAGFVYRTRVVIKKGRIDSVQVLENRKSPYAYYAEGVISKVVRDQNANTDTVTGATTTSKALLKSVENALRKAE